MPSIDLDIPDHFRKYEEDILDAADRAIEAGAEEPLEFVGIGMTSAVFCGAEGRAWKAARRLDDINGQVLEEEFEFLRDARDAHDVRDYVVRVYHWNPDLMVIEKECLYGRPGNWGDSSKLRRVHDKISDGMIPFGWCCPEFKEDSYVFVGSEDVHDDGEGPVLVDGGMALMVGETLMDYADDVLHGRRRYPDRKSSIAFAIQQEIRNGSIEQEEGEEMIERLGGF